MKKDFHISTWIDEPTLLDNLVEKLASLRKDSFHAAKMVTDEYQSVDTASTQTFVSGTLQMEQGIGQEAILIKTPFITQFFFTCIRESNDEYGLVWNMSMS